MLLKDTRIKNAKPTDRAFKLSDGEGLHLEVKPNGSKLWRLRYRLHGKESVFAIGKYPTVSLAEARERKTKARELISKGINPSLHRKQEKVRLTHESKNTFKAIAEEWLGSNAKHWESKTYIQRARLLTNDVYPSIGSIPIRAIDPAQILEIIQRVERRAPTMAIIVQQSISAVFRWAVITLRAKTDPTISMKGVLKKRETKHHPILETSELPAFLQAVDDYQGFFTIQLALQLLILTLSRSNEVLQAAWCEFDLEGGKWTKPADKVKMREVHTVPLSRQALELLRRLQPLTGHRQFLFPNRSDPRKPASKGVLWKAFISMGYKDRFAPHGLRGTGSTLLNEMGYRPDAIEKQLDHSERNRNRASYNHAEYFPERIVMMQGWADYLDSLRSGDNVVPIKKSA